MLSKTHVTLYHYWRSSCSWRVRWALALKGISFESIPVNLLNAEQTTPEYQKLNPMGYVPAIQYQDGVYGESLAIVEWLDETFPQQPLLPKDLLLRMRTRQLAYTIACGTQPLQNLSTQKFHSSDKDEQLRFACHWIQKGLEAYEALLAVCPSGTYSMGADITLADLCLVPQCYNAERFSVPLPPKIAIIYQNCLSTPECKEAAPESWVGLTN